MTNQEQKSIDSIYQLLSNIKLQNDEFKSHVTKQVEAINKKVEEKHEPLSLEKEVINTLNSSLQQAFHKTITDSYNSPLRKFADNIVNKYQKDIESIFDKIVSDGIKTPEFKKSVQEVFLSKLAKTVISGVDSGIDKTVNLMKQDPIFRSRLTLAVNGLVEEFLKK